MTLTRLLWAIVAGLAIGLLAIGASRLFDSELAGWAVVIPVALVAYAGWRRRMRG
jgi:hypothetical protein